MLRKQKLLIKRLVDTLEPNKKAKSSIEKLIQINKESILPNSFCKYEQKFQENQKWCEIFKVDFKEITTLSAYVTYLIVESSFT